MTAAPVVVAPDDEPAVALDRLRDGGFRHLPVLDGDDLVGIVSVKDLLPLARIAPVDGPTVAKGLAGVVVAETSVGTVDGQAGEFRYRDHLATDVAANRSFEDAWHLLLRGHLPSPDELAAFRAGIAPLRHLPDGLARQLPQLARAGEPLQVVRTAVSALGAELEFAPWLDVDRATLERQALQVCAALPTIVMAVHRLQAELDLCRRTTTSATWRTRCG